jgi:peroxiredoxin
MLKPKEKAPNIEINLVNGTKWILDEQSPEHFTLGIFYRGEHCPVCKKQLQTLQGKLPEFTDRGVNIIAISADTAEKAKKTYEEWDIAEVQLGYGFEIDKAREWGLYISKGIKDEPETFIEPGMFLVRPDGALYSASVQSMPFARPRFDDVLKAIDYIVKKDYPARGEA